MPKSRRDKVISLTQTKKKDREWKGGLIEQIREALETYQSVFVFDALTSATTPSRS
jgi:mRNA turnover protein 4